MNIGWIFVLCALLILVIMSLRPRRGAERAVHEEKNVRKDGPDTEGLLPVVETPGEDVRRSMSQGIEQT